MEFIIDILKYIAIPTSLLAIISMIIKVITYTDFDMLFLTKEKNTYLKIVNFIFLSSIFYIALLFFGLGLSAIPPSILVIMFLLILISSIISFLGLLFIYCYKKLKYHLEKKAIKEVRFNTLTEKILFWTNLPSTLLLISLVISILYIESPNLGQNDTENSQAIHEQNLTIQRDMENSETTRTYNKEFITYTIFLYFFTLILNLIYLEQLPKVLEQSRSRNYYTIKVISQESIKNTKLTVLYSLNSDTLVLGDKTTEYESNKLYHFNKSQDTVLEFTKSTE